MKPTCKGTKIDGGRCGQVNLGPSGYCHRHSAQIPDLPPIEVAQVEEPKPAPAHFDEIKDLTTPVKTTNLDERAKIAAERRKAKRSMVDQLGGYAGQRMLAHKREGYHRHWINDSGTRIEEMLDKGYDFVLDRDSSINNDDLGTRKSLQVSKHGPPVTAYLMEIPEEIYLEDQHDKEAVIQRTESSIRQASDGIGGERDSRGQAVSYNPSKSGNHLLE